MEQETGACCQLDVRDCEPQGEQSDRDGKHPVTEGLRTTDERVLVWMLQVADLISMVRQSRVHRMV